MKIEKHWIPLIILVPVLFLIPAFVKSADVNLKIIVTFSLILFFIYSLWKLFCVVFDISISVCKCTKFVECEKCKKESKKRSVENEKWLKDAHQAYLNKYNDSYKKELKSLNKDY